MDGKRALRPLATAFLAVVLLSVAAAATTLSKWHWIYSGESSRLRVKGTLSNPLRGYQNSRLVTLRAWATYGGREHALEEFKVTVLPDSRAEFEHDYFQISEEPAYVRLSIVTEE